MLQRLAGIDIRNRDPDFRPGPEVDTDTVGVADQEHDTLATRPEYIADPSRGSADPTAVSLISILSDMLAVLLGTYSGSKRPEQLNISPGYLGATSFLTTHVRYHVTAIKGSSGTAGQIIDIKVGTEIVETIFNFVGGAFAFPASLWIDRGAQVTAVERAAAVTFSCILIASEAD